MAKKKATPAPFRVRVPASTSNLGPGFDCLGMAVNLSNVFHVTPLARGANAIAGRGTCEAIRGRSNVFFRAMRAVGRLTGGSPLPVQVMVEGKVPVARGLGSSATAIVAGALAANHLLGSPLEPADLLPLLVKLEGHPDNVAPALLGGLTASARIGRDIVVHGYRPHRAWRLAILIPDYELSTETARAAIPAQVPHADAVFNLTRVPLILDALTTGDADALAMVMEDRLHEPYRRPLVARYDAIRKAARRAGAAGVYLSGAGPAMAAFCLGEPCAREVAAAMLGALGRSAGGAAATVLKPADRGATIRA